MKELPDETEGLLVVSSLERAQQNARNFEFVLTIEDPGLASPLRMPAAGGVQEVLTFHDIDAAIAGWNEPQEEHLARILSFARRSHGRSLLVHCQSGVSRSTAATIAILADRLGWQDPPRVIALARACHENGNPGANFLPNQEILRLADRLLSTGGRLVQALAAAEEKDPRTARLRGAYQRLMRFKAARSVSSWPADTKMATWSG